MKVKPNDKSIFKEAFLHATLAQRFYRRTALESAAKEQHTETALYSRFIGTLILMRAMSTNHRKV